MNNEPKSGTSDPAVESEPRSLLQTVVLTVVLTLGVSGLLALFVWLRHSTQEAVRKTGSGAGSSASTSLPEKWRHGAMTPPAGGKAAEGKAIVKGGWGSAPGQFGRRSDPETAQEGPMSLAVAKDGQLYVLDQINGRVQRFRRDGTPAGEIKIGSDTVQDMAVDKKGNVIALDRLADRDVSLFGPDGQPKTRLPVVGGPITEGGGVTGLYTDDSGIWLGREHAEIVRVADADGNADPKRPTEPGPPTRDGRFFLWARLADPQSVLLRIYDHDAQVVWSRTIGFGRPLLHLITVDSDLRGHVYAAGLAQDATIVLRLAENNGADAGSLLLPADPGIIESFRGLTVGDDGTIYQMLASDSGVTITAYTFP